MESNRLECNVEVEARILLHFFSSERDSHSPSEALVKPQCIHQERSRSSEQNFCVEIVKEVQTSVRLCAE
jgi:hypothetical protein